MRNQSFSPALHSAELGATSVSCGGLIGAIFAGLFTFLFIVAEPLARREEERKEWLAWITCLYFVPYCEPIHSQYVFYYNFAEAQ